MHIMKKNIINKIQRKLIPSKKRNESEAKKKKEKEIEAKIKKEKEIEAKKKREKEIEAEIKRKFKNYNAPEILLTSNEDKIIVKVLSKNIFPDSYIELKHRSTGKRIERKINENIAVFPLDEIVDMKEEEIFDFYIKLKTNKSVLKKRVKYNHKNQFFKAITSENQIITTYSTGYHNISLDIEYKDFDHNITDLSIKNDNISIAGNVILLNDEIKDLDKIEIIGRNRLDSQSNVFNMNFKKSEDNMFDFEGVIDKINVDADCLNLRMDFYIRIYYDDIYYQYLIDLTNYKDFSYDEDRYLLQIEKENKFYSFYATESRNSFALRITSKYSWLKSYTKAKGRTIYLDTMKNHDLEENLVFFESFYGKSYSGNPKYIYETMLKMGYDKKYKFVWAYNKDNPEIIPGNPIIVNRNEAGDYYRYLSLAKFWVNNILFPIHTKRNGNIYLQTWHGTPLKKIGYDITIPGPEIEGRRNFYNESRNWDYLISSNEYSSEIFKRAFKFQKEMLELGYPVNDIFFKDNAELIDSIKNKYDIPKDKKIILYAPTWKDDEQKEYWEHYFNLEIDLERLYEEFNDEYIILLKMHHLVSERLDIDENLKDFAIDLSLHDDIQELYVMADILITDYSSVFFDYAHSKRPIIFFVPDLNHYMENVRGLYLNMETELPGPLIQNNDDLIESIRNIDKVSHDYKERYEVFYERFCSVCKGDSGEKIVERIFGEID